MNFFGRTVSNDGLLCMESIAIPSEAEIANASIAYEQKNQPHKIYALLRRKRVVYIGQTKDIAARLAQHSREKEFDSYWCLDVDKEQANLIEARFIVALNPLMNRVLPKQFHYATFETAREMHGMRSLKAFVKSGDVTEYCLHVGRVYKYSELLEAGR